MTLPTTTAIRASRSERSRHEELCEHDDEQRDPEVAPENRLIDEAEHAKPFRHRLYSP